MFVLLNVPTAGPRKINLYDLYAILWQMFGVSRSWLNHICLVWPGVFGSAVGVVIKLTTLRMRNK